MNGGPVRVAVLGSPIGHSLSPVLHRAAYAELGLTDWTYQAIECAEDRFAAWFAELGPQWRGLSLTMPLKQVAIPLLDEVTDLARAVGAVNTVTWDASRPSGGSRSPGGSRWSIGDNTDVQGIVAALRSVGVRSVGSACILGSGATACSAIAAVARMGATDVVLQGRPVDRGIEALAVADRLGVRATLGRLEQVDVALAAEVVIATLPAAPAATWAASLPVGVRPAGALLDVTYFPWPTPAATAWTAAEGIAVGGFEMLLNQAAAQVTLMTGHPAPIDAMRSAGEKALS